MKLIYGTNYIFKGKKVLNTNGLLRCVGILEDDFDYIVCTFDLYTKKYNISKIINKFEINMIDSKNMERIENDEKWKEYVKFFESKEIIK